MTIKGVGIDGVNIKRFSPFKSDRENRFLTDNFSMSELDYCFSFTDPVVHLAGTFAAKEAVWKALRKKDLHQSAIEVKREEDGCPEIFIGGCRQKNILISISHTNEVALAIAIRQ